MNQDLEDDNDLFNFSLKYNKPTNPLKALYNGNISQTSWHTLSADASAKTYTYSYDALNRITAATGVLGSKYDISGIQYDKNGNILNLLRKGHTNLAATTFGVMDNLVYTYDSGNKLKKVLDNGNDNYGFKDGVNTTTEYTYDANGNMKTDGNKGITNITYNHLNLPTRVTIGGKNIDYTYDAAGVKLSKMVEGVTTQYAGNYIYENNTLQFFNHPEGYVKPVIASGSVEISSFDYVYQYKDHLGNVRLSYADNNNDGVIQTTGTGTEIVEESNYYPFGLKHKGYNGNVSSLGNSVAQKFGYNGKELNEEIGVQWHDFGARNYDAALGRWMNIDPLAEAYTNVSLFAYAFNNPTFFIDPDGMRVDVSNILKKDKKGNYVNKEVAEIFLQFAKTKIGIEFLSKFAQAGQVIAGHEYKESGEYHDQGIDLSFGSTNLNYLTSGDSDTQGSTGSDGVTRIRGGKYIAEKRGKATIDIYINNQLNQNREEAKNYSKNKNDPKAKSLFVLQRISTLLHEIIIHADSYAKDLSDNCKLDCSNIKGNYNSNNTAYKQHMDARKPGSLFLKKTLPVMINLHKKSKTGLSKSKIKEKILKYAD